MASTIVTFELGGREVEVMVKPMTTLQSVLRNQLGATAVKDGCRQGGCGSCTVLVDGEPMASCLLPVEDVAGRRVTTLESITPAEGLHPIQRAFLDADASQCGYCTPGMVMVSKALLDHDPAPTDEDIEQALAGNICRCTGYRPIVRADPGRGRGDGRRRAERAAAMSPDLNVVGRSVGRSDGIGHVTGRTLYTADHAFPGMLHLKMVRSPLHHANVKGIDLADAERVPGFVRALTAADVPHNRYTILGLIGVEPEEEFVLAEDRVRFKGEAIVAIVAESEDAALEAVSKVHLDLEELPAVFDVEEALRPGAPIVTHWGNNTFMYEGHPCRRVRLGDVEAAFAQADHIVEGVYNTSPIEHAPIETTGCIAVPEANGRYTVYTNTQALYFSLDNTAIIVQVPGNVLHFVGGTVGGGFGGKVDVIVEPIATLAAMLTNRPVRYAYSRSEEMQVSSTRAAWRIYIKDGVIERRPHHRPQGDELRRLRRVQPPDPVRAHQARRQCRGPVRDPERLDRRLLRLHEPPADQRDAGLRGDDGVVRPRGPDGQDRRAGGPRSVDDPLPQRLPQRRHEAAPQARRGRDADRDDAGRRGARRPRAAGRVHGDDLGATRRRRPGGALTMAKLRGTGIAAVNYPTGMNLGGDPSQALIHATTSGSFVVSLSATDLGQGLRTVIGQIAAETLGVAFEEIVVDTGDTDTGPHDMGTFASRATHRVGNAVIAAATEARAALLDVAAEELEAAVGRAGDRRAGQPHGQGRPRPVGEGRRHRLRWPSSSTAGRSPAAGLHEAEERGGPRDRGDGSRLDRGPCLHRGGGRGRHGDRRGHGPQHPERLRGRPPGQPGARRGPDRGRRLDGACPTPCTRRPRRTTRRRSQPAGLQRVPDARPAGDAGDRVRRPRDPVRRTGRTGSRASAR